MKAERKTKSSNTFNKAQALEAFGYVKPQKHGHSGELIRSHINSNGQKISNNLTLRAAPHR